MRPNEQRPHIDSALMNNDRLTLPTASSNIRSSNLYGAPQMNRNPLVANAAPLAMNNMNPASYNYSSVPLAHPNLQAPVYANSFASSAQNVHQYQPNTTTVPATMISPGSKLRIGQHKVKVERYLSDGGFSHVYLVQIEEGPKRFQHGIQTAVLKRMAVKNKEELQPVKHEIDAMIALSGHPNIVEYYDSHASQSTQGNGFEVFLLMEYCQGGGLIDFMNTRLTTRLKEIEVLNIAKDIAQAVSKMHSLSPPLIHRDLKVENVLLQGNIYKLCDFGSACEIMSAPKDDQQAHQLDFNIRRYTTLQYRAPEMLTIHQERRPIDEKSDIWALGVLVYKLCYYTTPFENSGPMAIVQAQFAFPMQPRYSDRLKRFIAVLLQADPKLRPNITQTIREIHEIIKLDSDHTDFQYTSLPSKQPTRSKSSVSLAANMNDKSSSLSEIVPLQKSKSLDPSDDSKFRSVLNAARQSVEVSLDSGDSDSSLVDVEKRFPSIDQLSISDSQSTISKKYSFPDRPVSNAGMPTNEQTHREVAIDTNDYLKDSSESFRTFSTETLRKADTLSDSFDLKRNDNEDASSDSAISFVKPSKLKALRSAINEDSSSELSQLINLSSNCSEEPSCEPLIQLSDEIKNSTLQYSSIKSNHPSLQTTATIKTLRPTSEGTQEPINSNLDFLESLDRKKQNKFNVSGTHQRPSPNTFTSSNVILPASSLKTKTGPKIKPVKSSAIQERMNRLLKSMEYDKHNSYAEGYGPYVEHKDNSQNEKDFIGKI